jgi:uncharacterized protein (DUF433 family)
MGVPALIRGRPTWSVSQGGGPMPDRSKKYESNQAIYLRFRYTSPSVARQKYNPWEIPNYSIEEGSRYLHVPESTIRYWIIGEAGAAPLTTVYSRSPLLLSFKNLVECYVLESLRHTHDIGLTRIRKDVEELRRERPSKYPLADYQLATRGRKIYLEGDGNELVSLTAGGQHAFKEILDPFLKRVDRNTRGIAERLFPFTRVEHQKSPGDAPRIVVIDPNVAFGKPVLVGSRISTSFLLSRKRGGASIRQLAADYGRTQEEIEEAIYLEEVHKAAA